MASRAGTSALEMYRSARRRQRRRKGGVLVLAAMAGAGWVLGWPRPAVVLLLGAALAGLIGAVVPCAGRDIDRWRRGAAGERRTAGLLDGLPSRRWAVWHDLRVPGSRSNIDHVVAGRTGIWVVDTKSTRAPVGRGWRTVRFGDRELDTTSTRWEAQVVSDRLERGLGHPVVVRPIVAVHDLSGRDLTGRVARGRGLRAGGTRVRGVRVVPAPVLVGRIRRGRRRLGRRELREVGAVMDTVFGGPGAGNGRAGGRAANRLRAKGTR
jgi:hypothetical protein